MKKYYIGCFILSLIVISCRTVKTSKVENYTASDSIKVTSISKEVTNDSVNIIVIENTNTDISGEVEEDIIETYYSKPDSQGVQNILKTVQKKKRSNYKVNQSKDNNVNITKTEEKASIDSSSLQSNTNIQNTTQVSTKKTFNLPTIIFWLILILLILLILYYCVKKRKQLTKIFSRLVC